MNIWIIACEAALLAAAIAVMVYMIHNHMDKE